MLSGVMDKPFSLAGPKCDLTSERFGAVRTDCLSSGRGEGAGNRRFPLCRRHLPKRDHRCCGPGHGKPVASGPSAAASQDRASSPHTSSSYFLGLPSLLKNVHPRTTLWILHVALAQETWSDPTIEPRTARRMTIPKMVGIWSIASLPCL